MLYVALSRVRRLEDLTILRPFSAQAVQPQPSAELIADMLRLRELATHQNN
jgi:hypothetical protein